MNRQILGQVLGAVALLVMVAVSTAAVAQTPNCVPSCEVDDGRFLVITDGVGLETLTDTTLDLQIRSPGAGFTLGFFDGETSGAEGLWDLRSNDAPAQLDFVLYADPDGDGISTEVLHLFDGEAMSDNDWSDFFVADAAPARSPTGEYVYLLRANFLVADPGMRTLFKVKTDADVFIEVFQQPFSFTAAVPDPIGATRLEIIYPDCAGMTPFDCLGYLENTTYNGDFRFFLTVRQPQEELVIWDGDLDHGDWDGLNPDSDDDNTLDGFNGLPYWACRDLDPASPCTADGGSNPRLASVNFEGVALGRGVCDGGSRDGKKCQPGCPGAGAYCDVNHDAPGSSLCVGGSRNGLLCQPGCDTGECTVTGDPPDDFLPGLGEIFRRDGSVSYEVWGPDARLLATNDDPSGNREWEVFRLAVPGTSAYLDENGFPPDVDVDELPAGIYEVRVKDLDLENLNAFRFGAAAGTEPNCEDGRPTGLTFIYTADSCDEPAASNNSQGGLPGTTGDYECSGPLTTGDPRAVKLVPVKKPERFEMVPEFAYPGDELIIRAKTKNDRLFPHTELEVQDAVTGEVLQEVTLHTSCSQPLIVGEQFGSLKLFAYFLKF